MITPFMPSSEILSLSQQLAQAQIPDAIIEELVKASYGVSLKKGDQFQPSVDEGVLIYVRSGCIVEMLELSDAVCCASSVWTMGYSVVCLTPNRNRFQHHHNHFHCLFDAELTVITKSTIARLNKVCPPLHTYVLGRAAEYLHTSHNMALLRSSLDKRQNIILRLMILNTRTQGDKLKMTVDDLCMLTNTTRQYCSGVIKQLEQRNLIAKHYGHLHITDIEGLRAMCLPEVLEFLKHYMSLTKPF